MSPRPEKEATSQLQKHARRMCTELNTGGSGKEGGKYRRWDTRFPDSTREDGQGRGLGKNTSSEGPEASLCPDKDLEKLPYSGREIH